MVSANDAFDVITDPSLASKTTFLKRNFALRLAAQAAFDAWYSHEEPEELVKWLEEGNSPEQIMMTKLLEFSGSIDAKTLDVLRDVGVGAPQVGIPGVGVPVQNAPTQVPEQRRKLFGK